MMKRRVFEIIEREKLELLKEGYARLQEENDVLRKKLSVVQNEAFEQNNQAMEMYKALQIMQKTMKKNMQVIQDLRMNMMSTLCYVQDALDAEELEDDEPFEEDDAMESEPTEEDWEVVDPIKEEEDMKEELKAVEFNG